MQGPVHCVAEGLVIIASFGSTENCVCLQLGAQVSRTTDGSTTHVVAGGDRTDKVLWARRKGVHAVAAAWLHTSGGQLIAI